MRRGATSSARSSACGALACSTRPRSWRRRRRRWRHCCNRRAPLGSSRGAWRRCATGCRITGAAARWRSLLCWWAADCGASRSAALLLALADCTASSRIRWRLLVVSASAPSAVWTSEIPSLALRIAWLRPRTWEVKRSEIASPAASSLALLMRSPEDSRSSAVPNVPCERLRLRWALSDIRLVLMVCGMVDSPGRAPAGRLGGRAGRRRLRRWRTCPPSTKPAPAGPPAKAARRCPTRRIDHATDHQHQPDVAQRPAQPQPLAGHVGDRARAAVLGAAHQQRQGRCRRARDLGALHLPGPRPQPGDAQRQRRDLAGPDRRGCARRDHQQPPADPRAGRAVGQRQQQRRRPRRAAVRGPPAQERAPARGRPRDPASSGTAPPGAAT